MLDAVTNKKNSLHLLDSLVKQNIFTTKTKGEQFRYHTLFRKHILKDVEVSKQKALEHKAALYYYELQQYSQAAKYAILANNTELLEKIIVESYEEQIKNGNFSELRNWFKALGSTPATSSQKISLVRGVFLSSIGNFSEAKTWLDNGSVPALIETLQQSSFIKVLSTVMRNARRFSPNLKAQL